MAEEPSFFERTVKTHVSTAGVAELNRCLEALLIDLQVESGLDAALTEAERALMAKMTAKMITSLRRANISTKPTSNPKQVVYVSPKPTA